MPYMQGFASSQNAVTMEEICHHGSMKKWTDIQNEKKYSNTNLTRIVSIFYIKELVTKIF